MGKLGQDIRYSLRTSVRTKSVALLAVLAFALGIGVTSAVFSIFNGVLLAPLPFPDPGELVLVYGTQPACSTCPASFPKYHDWKTRNHVFAAMGGWTQASFVLTGLGAAEQASGLATTASLNDVFRVQPILGRWYTEQEDQPGGPKLVVLSQRFWERRFNRDRGALGRRILFDGEPYEVIGVMPSTFTRSGDFYVPLQRKLDPATRGQHFLVTFARLERGVPLERATMEMRSLGEALAREFGYNHGIDVRSYREAVVGGIRGPLRVLMGAVLCVLLIACANVANLLLASGMARRREIAVRLALGAGQKDIARQLTCESLLLALAGGALGLLMATWIVRVFVVLAGDNLPRAGSIQVDGRVLAFTAAISIVVGIVCGLSPLLRLRLKTLTSALREDTRTGSGGSATFGNGLVVAEIAVAFALLVGAGLMVKNLILLERRDAGITTERVIAFNIAPTGPRYRQPEAVSALYRSLHERLANLGGVQHAGLISHLPMYRFGDNGEMQREGGNPWGPMENPLVEYRYLYGDYLKALGIPFLRGRPLDSRDGPKTPSVLVNQAMAEKFWPNEDPIGKRFGQGRDSTTFTVVGVVGNIRSFGLARTTPYEFYRTTDQVPYEAMTVVLRSSGVYQSRLERTARWLARMNVAATAERSVRKEPIHSTYSADPASLVPSARAVVESLDPDLPITNIQTMVDVVSASVGQPRLLSALSGLFGGLAGLLAMVGVYGVTSYNVRRQRREYGIRLALGAEPRAVQRLIVRRGAVAAAIGIAVGGVAALLLTRVLGSMLNDVKPTDPTVFAANAAAVMLVSMAACYLPARWAGRVDPATVLRTE